MCIRDRYLGDTLGELVDPTAAALDPAGTYVVEWKDAYFFGSQAFGLVNELRRAGYDVGAGEFWTVPITSSRVVPTGTADEAIVFVTGGFVEDWRADDRFVEVATVDPRTDEELAEYAQLRTELIADLDTAGLDDLVPLVDTNLFGLNIDQRISATARTLSARLIRLGQETAVFLGPPGTAVPGAEGPSPTPTTEPVEEAVEAPAPILEHYSGLRCSSDEAISESYDYVADAFAYETPELAAGAWWFIDAPAYFDQQLLTEGEPTDASSGAVDIPFSDEAGNPQVVLSITEFGDGWLVGEAHMCATATLPDE